jgi:hypothetical protein
MVCVNNLNYKKPVAIDLKQLPSGNHIFSNEENEIVFKDVFEYI